MILLVLTLSCGGPYHIETSPLIFRANESTGFYMIGTSVMKELNTEKEGKEKLLIRTSFT